MRINGKKVIALAITIVMLCLQPAQSLSGTHVEAESRQQYVARLKQFDSVKALEKAGYEPVCDQDGNTADLNQGTGKKAVYLGYVKTKNPEEAITDIAVLDMKGDYIFNDYKEILKTQKTEIRAQLNDFKTAVSEFRNNYNRKTKMAEYAYSLLDYYVDGKEGDVYAGQGEYKDSGRKLSDLFTDETLSDKKLEKILLQSNDTMLRNIDTYLALATVSDSGERLLKKASKIKKKNIAYKKVKKKAQVLVEYIPKLQEELAAYTDDPLENVMDQNELQNKLNDYDQDEQPGYLASMTLYLLLNQYSYGSSTLAQLVLEEEPTWRDMAALASCMTDAQVTLAEYIGLGQMLMLSAVNCKQWQKATRDTSYVEHMNRAKEQVCLRLEKEKNLTADRAKKAVSSLSVYEGAERAIYEDGVGLTNAALRKNVSTDDSVAAWENISNVTEGFFGGIGVVVGKKENNFVVVAPLEGTPGEKAGIKAGDKIVQVDGKKTAGMQLEDVVAMIRGTQGTEVELVLDDNKGNERTVRVVRGDIKIKSVAGEMLPDSRIGYIRIAIFNENTSGEFAKKYQELEEQGMQALLLDLRQNPGGILGESVRVAQYLVPKGPIVSVIDREGRKYTEESYLEQVKYPLAVLVDHGSASASEIVAGAVQDTKSGKLFGTRTFGKGSVQTVYRLPQNTGLKLTTAKYYTPSGRSINGTGITPDEVVELPEQPTKDIQLETAENYLRNLQK